MRTLTLLCSTLVAVVVVGCGGNDRGTGGGPGSSNPGSSGEEAADRGTASDPGTGTDPGTGIDPGSPASKPTTSSCVAACNGRDTTTCGPTSMCGGDPGVPAACLRVCLLGSSDCPGTAECLGDASETPYGVCLVPCTSASSCARPCDASIVVRCAPLGVVRDAPSSGPSYCLYSAAEQAQPGAGS
jgi:hypothetical protein